MASISQTPSTPIASTSSQVPASFVIPERTWRTTMRNALIITRREVRDSFRDWRIVTPIIILTFLFPFLAQSIATSFREFLEGYGAELIGERTIPFLLMIVGFFPISISLVIALETFVGEKERRSLEPLLSTPMTNTELYIGKTLAAMIPPLIASFGGMLVYLSTLLGSELAWRPEAMLVVQIFLLTLVQALVMVTGAVVVSSQTTSTRAANLLASFIIIPMTLIVNVESIIMFMAPDAESPRGIGALWAIIVGMIVVVAILLRMGNSIFNREELLGRSLDAINLSGIFKKIWRYVRAVNDAGDTAPSLLAWYSHAIPYSLGKLKVPVLLTVGVFSVAFSAGYIFGQQPGWQLPSPGELAFSGDLSLLDEFLNLSTQEQIFSFILRQNSQVLSLTAFLSAISLGVMAFILPPVTFVVLGYLFSQMVLWGMDLSLFWTAILPHGIIEIPVIVLATAAAFRLGAVITRPQKGATVGHSWIIALGDTIKLAFGVILPGLIIAAVLEVTVTPALLRMLITG